MWVNVSPPTGQTISVSTGKPAKAGAAAPNVRASAGDARKIPPKTVLPALPVTALFLAVLLAPT